MFYVFFKLKNTSKNQIITPKRFCWLANWGILSYIMVQQMTKGWSMVFYSPERQLLSRNCDQPSQITCSKLEIQWTLMIFFGSFINQSYCCIPLLALFQLILGAQYFKNHNRTIFLVPVSVYTNFSVESWPMN